MGQNGVLGNEYTFSTLAKVCGVVGDLGVGKWVHGKCIKYGLVSDSVVGSSLMSMYGKCGGREDLCRVFEEMPKRSVSSWNVMLSRCVDGENGEKAFSFVKCMLMEGLKPNQFTLSNLLPLCGSGLVWGRMRFKNVFAWTEMMSGYLQNGDPDETVLIFREMLRRQLEMNEVTLLTLLPASKLTASDGADKAHPSIPTGSTKELEWTYFWL
ncbi:pentatricopeptide repeat-containing protein [Tanacetum coccineum]|uniref:Pentatricopeptide repeat-containing protein n=1 Tax=Tanacetum coccineum TaxID=301880 RepID=A0ABQ4Y3L8_9ASTR